MRWMPQGKLLELRLLALHWADELVFLLDSLSPSVTRCLLSLTLSLVLPVTRWLLMALFHSSTLSLSLTRCHPHSFCLSLSHSLSLCLPDSLSLSLTHSMSLSLLTRCLPHLLSLSLSLVLFTCSPHVMAPSQPLPLSHSLSLSSLPYTPSLLFQCLFLIFLDGDTIQRCQQHGLAKGPRVARRARLVRMLRPLSERAKLRAAASGHRGCDPPALA